MIRRTLGIVHHIAEWIARRHRFESTDVYLVRAPAQEKCVNLLYYREEAFPDIVVPVRHRPPAVCNPRHDPLLYRLVAGSHRPTNSETMNFRITLQSICSRMPNAFTRLNQK